MDPAQSGRTGFGRLASPFCSLLCVLGLAAWASAQQIPGEYQQILEALGKQGDFKENVLKISLPRNDLRVTVDGVATPTPFGFGGWLAMTKGDGGQEVMMGDLVLLENEVNPVVSALLEHGLEVTALHNHFFYEQPRIFYLHVMGHGAAADLARRVKPAVDLIGKAAPAPQGPAPPANAAAATLDSGRIAQIVGIEGEQSGSVYKITVGREDLQVKMQGASIQARMGLNSWAAFLGSDASAVVAGDVAMLATELTPVLRALRDNGLEVVSIHHHMTGVEPMIVFLHYWGKGPAARLAAGFKSALDQLGKGGVPSQALR